MNTLYIANKNYSSWSLRPWVLMKEHQIPFEEKLVPFQGSCNTDEFSKFAPNAKVPCLHDDGFVVWESLAICEYLADRNEGLWPEDHMARSWARCAAAEMHSGFYALRNTCGMSVGVRIELFEYSDELKADVQRIDELWNEGLEKFGGPYLAGSTFTIVDAFFAPVAFRWLSFGFELSDTSKAYCELLLNLDSMKEWEESALLEPWRDHDHEKDMANVGKVILDKRKA